MKPDWIRWDDEKTDFFASQKSGQVTSVCGRYRIVRAGGGQYGVFWLSKKPWERWEIIVQPSELRSDQGAIELIQAYHDARRREAAETEKEIRSWLREEP